MSNDGTKRAGASDGDTRESRLRTVSCELEFDVVKDATVELQIVAANSAGSVLAEALDITVDGDPVDSVTEISGPHDARIQVVQCPRGTLHVFYRAEIEVAVAQQTATEAEGTAGAGIHPPRNFAELLYLRPSRYCQSDYLGGFALSEFGSGGDVAANVNAIIGWIRGRVEYVPGAGTVHDSAEDTLLTGMGACRDFAHLGIAMCRAIGVAARYAAVYAPGLSPMDFHAVFETLQNGHWVVHDPTGLAPRSSFVRIATGRDAADVAFASFERLAGTLTEISVSATTGSVLPTDDWTSPIELA